MKLPVAFAIVTVASIAFADQGPLHKNIQKEIVKQHERVQAECGCSVTFSYDRKLDFTVEEGPSLALNVKSVVDDVGTRSVQWCKKGDDFRAKYCAMVKSLEITQDPTTRRPYTTAVARGVIRSHIATGNPKQISHHGGAWVEKFLQSGKMPERKLDE